MPRLGWIGRVGLAAGAVVAIGGSIDVRAQTSPDSVAVVADAQASGRRPIFVALGGGYGLRKDGCVLCASPQDDRSFTGHLSVGKYLVGGLGVGVDASVWRRGRPGPVVAESEEAAPPSASLINMLGNASLAFSYQIWRVYVKAGGGVAWGAQDLELLEDGAGSTVSHSSGLGIGYSVGAGVALPIHPMVSILFYGNWNVGQYDMTGPGSSTQRDVQHRYLELGIGVTSR